MYWQMKIKIVKWNQKMKIENQIWKGELNYVLLAKYDELDKLVEKITKETKIKYWQMCDYDIYYVYIKWMED